MQQETQRAEELLHCLMREALLRSAAQLLPEAQISTCRKNETPADGVITGYGVIDGNLVYVYSQDAAVLNGAIGEMHAKKIARIYDMAMKMGAPVVGLIDCAGLRLQEASDALEAFGMLYQKQALASGVIPQITAIFGSCGGGLSVVPGLTDFTFMEEKGKLFVNSPNALPGNEISRCDTSSAAFQSEHTGLVDGTGTEEEILSQIRELILMLPCNNEEDVSYEDCSDDLNRVCGGIENAAEDAAIVLSQISDDGVFFETKRQFARDMVTGFIKLNGMTVGAVANRSKVYDENAEVVEAFDGSLSADGAQKAAEFVTFCDAFHIPVLTITNVEGFAASDYDEKHLAKAAAKLTYAFANATVPKVNVITRKAFGSAYVAMNSKSVGADMVYCMEGIPDRYDGRHPGCKDHVCRRGYGSDKGKGFRIRQTAEQSGICRVQRLCGYHHRAGRHQKICDRSV